MRRLILFPVVALLMAACVSPEEPPPPPPPQNPPPPTEAFVIVTLPPAATPTEPTAPEPAFDVSPYLGQWQLNFRYQFDDGAVIQQTRFVGGVLVQVDRDASVFGQGTLIVSVRHDGCFAQVLDGEEVAVTVEGDIRQGQTGLELAFELRPDNPRQVQRYRLACPAFTEPVEFEQQTLWLALNALRTMPYTMPLQPGFLHQDTVDVGGPTGQQLEGTLTTEIRLIR